MRRKIIAMFVAAVASVAALAAESEVTVYNRDAGVRLAGTLVVPQGAPRAVLVLATGSGQQDRDEEVAGHRPFRAIADYLATRGYATLRMDDRGVGGSTGDPRVATTDDYALDISAALAYVDSIMPGVPAGVLGHSEGGTVAVKTAVSDPRCRFIVTLAAPAWRGDSIIMSQARALATAMTGRWDGEALQRKLLDIARSDMSPSQVRMSMYLTAAEAVGEQLAALPQVQKQLYEQVDVMASVWYRTFLRYDPAQDIAGVEVPWLAMNGDKDFQVLPANLETIKTLNPRADTRLLKGFNHMFQKCITGFPQEYAEISSDIDPEALEMIAGWLNTLP